MIDQFLKETEVFAKRSQQMKVNVLIDTPKPVLLSPIFRCSDWFNRHNPICGSGNEITREFLSEMREPVMQSIRDLSKHYSNVFTWDPFNTLCPNEMCSAYNDKGIPLFFDGDHLSAHGNRVLYTEFEKVLSRIWLHG